MNEFVIDLVGQLNMSATVKNVKSDLKDLSNTLNQSGNERIELVGRLDPGETTKVLQNQLNLISQTLKLEIKSDGLNSVIESLAKIGKELSGLNAQQGVVQMFEATTDAIAATDNALGKLTQTTYRYHGAEQQLTDWTEVHKNGFTTTSITSGWGEDDEGNKRIEEKSRQVIDNYQAEDRAIQKATNTQIKYNEELARTFKLITDSDSSKYIKNTEAQGEAFDRILNVSAKVKSLGSITDAEQFTKQKMAIDADIQSLNDYLSVQRNIETQQKQSEKAAFNLTEQLAKLQSKYTDANSSKAITNTDNLDKLQDAAAEATTKIEALKNANSQTFTELDREAKKAVNNYDLMAAAMQKAETMATKLKAKPVSVVKAEALNELNEFEAGLRRLGISFDETITRFDGTVQPLRAAIQELRTEFDQVGNSQQKLTDFSYSFSEVETRVNEFKRQKGFFDNINSEIEKAGKDLDTLQSKLSGSKFSNSPGIHDLTEQLTQLRTEYDALKAALADKDPQAMDQMASEVKQNADAIKKKITEIDNAVRQFEKSANNAANSDLLSGKKKVLSNNIELWLKNNTKASESTRAALRRLQEQIESADKSQLRNLSQQFVEIKKNAEAAGETGKKFLDVFKQNISKFTSWYGIGNIVATISREIRQAISDLREMDTVLTEISKTSDRTEQELEQLGQASFDTASQYGRTAKDYLSGVLEMSRAGYENSESMAELAIKAQAAGDMTAELANQYLIATDAAYQLKGSEDELSKILDGQNKITNLNAVNMTELAQATKIAASQSASAGVSVEQMTAALGTMIATTQQGGEVAARAWRGILMNLQQVSGEIDAETGEVVKAEDLTKYEKAVNALGVSLKTVENGAIKLRDPIEILKELSEAYKELEVDDSRRANLLSAIGGKYICHVA